MRFVGWMLAASLLALTGCGRKVAEEPAQVQGETSKPGMALAYEHRVAITLPNGRLRERMRAVREACLAGTHGPCSLLRFEERSGSRPSGSVQVRIVPAGVEPLLQEAAAGGEAGSRSTHAEDLAAQVSDNAVERERLRRQRDTLSVLPAEGGLTVSDHIALSAELANIDTRLAALDRDAANLDRRIETNLLTLDFDAADTGSAWASIGDAFAEAPARFAEGLAEAIDWLALLLPIAIVAFPLALAWRGVWRWATRRRSSKV